MTTDYVADVPDVPASVQAFAEQWMQCPDCASTTAGVVATPDGFRIYTAHQPTCPNPDPDRIAAFAAARVKELGIHGN